MGAQNAAVRQLKVFDLTTTVLTMTLTGIAADMRQRDRFAIVRRMLAVGAMLAGAVLGAVLVLEVSNVAALGLATALLAVVVVRGESLARAMARAAPLTSQPAATTPRVALRLAMIAPPRVTETNERSWC